MKRTIVAILITILGVSAIFAESGYKTVVSGDTYEICVPKEPATEEEIASVVADNLRDNLDGYMFYKAVKYKDHCFEVSDEEMDEYEIQIFNERLQKYLDKYGILVLFDYENGTLSTFVKYKMDEYNYLGMMAFED